MSNKSKVKYNVSRLTITPIVNDVYETTPIHIPGTVGITLDPAGDSSEFYADGIPYFTQTKNNGYTGSIEVAMFPDDVLARLMGWLVDANNNIVETTNATPLSFAMSFQIDGDVEPRALQFLEVSLARPSVNANTTEASISPETDTMSLTAVPHWFDSIGCYAVKTQANGGDADFDKYFEGVVEPKAGATTPEVTE